MQAHLLQSRTDTQRSHQTQGSNVLHILMHLDSQRVVEACTRRTFPPTPAPAPAVDLMACNNQKRTSLTLTQQTQRLRVRRIDALMSVHPLERQLVQQVAVN